MGIFGWSYPPGCSSVPGDEPEPPCDICGQQVDNCICPECPTCGSQGDPRCYAVWLDKRYYREDISAKAEGKWNAGHGLIITPQQRWGRLDLEAYMEEEARAEAEYWAKYDNDIEAEDW